MAVVLGQIGYAQLMFNTFHVFPLYKYFIHVSYIWNTPKIRSEKMEKDTTEAVWNNNLVSKIILN